MTCGRFYAVVQKQGNILESAAQSMPWTTQTVRTRRHCQGVDATAGRKEACGESSLK
jgi:hypothetical protein